MKAIKAYVTFLIFLTMLTITPVLVQPYNLALVNWVKYIKLSEDYDYAFGTCIFGEYLAVVGHANGYLSLMLLDRSTGYIVRKWVGKDSGYFLNCFPVGDVLYAVGWGIGGVIYRKGTIYAFDKDLNLLNKAEGPSRSWFVSITYDGGYLYIGGSILKDINLDGMVSEEIWYIEKRTKSLELISYKELYTEGWRYGWIKDVGINPVTGELWAVGDYEETSNKNHSLIIIFDKELRELNRIDYPEDNEYYLGWLCGICFDNIGNAYVGGLRGVAKFDKYGNILKVNKDASASKITWINGFVYAFDDVYIDNYRRHVLYVLDSELSMIGKQALSKNVDADSLFSRIGRPCFDGKNVYVAGFDYALGKDKPRWVVYSINKGSYIVCIDGICNFYEKGSIISSKQDIPTLGGLIIKKFEGYLDSYGNNIGKSVVVNGPLTLSSYYREEINLPLLSVIIVIVLIPLFVIISKIKIGKKEKETELEKELAILNRRLAELEELYKKRKIKEYAYKMLKEKYERKKKEIEKILKSS